MHNSQLTMNLNTVVYLKIKFNRSPCALSGDSTPNAQDRLASQRMTRTSVSRLRRLRNPAPEQRFSKPRARRDRLKGHRRGPLGAPSASPTSRRSRWLVKFPGEAAVGLGPPRRTVTQNCVRFWGVWSQRHNHAQAQGNRRKPGILPRTASPPLNRAAEVPS